MTATEHAAKASELLTEGEKRPGPHTVFVTNRAQAHALTAIALTMTSWAVPIVGEVTAFTVKP